MKAVLLVGLGTRTSLEYCRSTFMQGAEYINAHIGPCDERATHPGVEKEFCSLAEYFSSSFLDS